MRSSEVLKYVVLVCDGDNVRYLYRGCLYLVASNLDHCEWHTIIVCCQRGGELIKCKKVNVLPRRCDTALPRSSEHGAAPEHTLTDGPLYVLFTMTLVRARLVEEVALPILHDQSCRSIGIIAQCGDQANPASNAIR